MTDIVRHNLFVIQHMDFKTAYLFYSVVTPSKTPDKQTTYPRRSNNWTDIETGTWLSGL